ncbi:ankyrin repeat-containing domain protein [Aspergillus stella-maris]|uniref:ankyrin repeat-containing domain protein n=1 Tax=Aspergillus stella-maris TaxID=1810926 RepID=UPI003CCCEA05
MPPAHDFAKGIKSILQRQIDDYRRWDNNGDTPLHVAATHGSTEAIDVLLSNEPTKTLINIQNNRGCTPLYLAAANGHREADDDVVEFLILQEEIEVNHRDTRGRSPLWVAASHGRTEVVLSSSLVPLTVIKGAGHEFIQLPKGENALTADFHSTRTKTDSSPTHITSGFYKIEVGPHRPAYYTYEETKYVLAGQIDVLDEATGITHHLVPGDFAFFYVGSKVKFSTKSHGLAFYAVTRPFRSPHVNLVERDDAKSKL